MRIKVGCYQSKCVPGDFEANFATVLHGMEAAATENVEIMAFPESFLTGYFCDETQARKYAFTLEGPEIARVLAKTARFDATFMVGFNERRGDRMHNTVLVAEKGQLLGTYSKAFPCYAYFTPGREFPVFSRGDVRFGVIICADGAFIEPARILALKGARIIFAPHYNYLDKSWVVTHYAMVRQDHQARAVENGVWFMRANNVEGPGDPAAAGFDGVGYGDSYLLDPLGQVVAHAGLHCEGLMTGTVDLGRAYPNPPAANSRNAARELGQQMLDAMREREANA
jgi:predicted amidohydrolase